jgi:trehalose-phosphatase
VNDVFLEIAPLKAHKGKAVEYFLRHYPLPDSRLIYIGDDDKDEEAFETVHAFGGKSVLVFNPDHPEPSEATDFQMESPEEVRRWMRKVGSH